MQIGTFGEVQLVYRSYEPKVFDRIIRFSWSAVKNCAREVSIIPQPQPQLPRTQGKMHMQWHGICTYEHMYVHTYIHMYVAQFPVIYVCKSMLNSILIICFGSCMCIVTMFTFFAFDECTMIRGRLSPLLRLTKHN
jgi:hypothetical protein